MAPRLAALVALAAPRAAAAINVTAWCASHAALPSGGFCPGAHYQGLDKRLAPQLVHYFKTRKATEGASVGDFGGGGGWYSYVFNRHPWLTATSYDYSPASKKVRFADLSRPLPEAVPAFDFVLCLEVGEHIPPAQEGVLLDNLVSRAKRGIVLSWARPGQNGTGHVNERPNDYIIAQMEERNWLHRPRASFALREAARFWWFRQSIMVFEPEEKPGGDFLAELLGGAGNVDALRDLWLGDSALRAAGVQDVEAFDDAAYGSIRDPLEATWVRLTRLLAATGRLPLKASQPVDDEHFWTPGCKAGACLPGGRVSIGRRMVNYWHAEQAARVPPGAVCGEFGDGHFVQDRGWRDRCASAAVFDKYDTIMRHAPDTVRLDLDAPPEGQAAGHAATLDVLVAHQVFEHLSRPSHGAVNANRLLKEGGLLVFSTPFLLLDQPSPRDYFRYTPAAVHQLLTCAGFERIEVRGIGGPLAALGYLGGLATTELDRPEERLAESCIHPRCGFRFYSVVAATAVKAREPGLERVATCFG